MGLVNREPVLRDLHAPSDFAKTSAKTELFSCDTNIVESGLALALYFILKYVFSTEISSLDSILTFKPNTTPSGDGYFIIFEAVLKKTETP